LPNGVTSQKTPFFIVTAVKTSDLYAEVSHKILLSVIQMTGDISERALMAISSGALAFPHLEM
jgi:hypothetical protein